MLWRQRKINCLALRRTLANPHTPGKFMAFPGEHYHKLLANLASEIYHNRYPVEHGVDILHGVMADAGAEALKVRYGAVRCGVA